MAALRPRGGVGRATGALHPGHLLSMPPAPRTCSVFLGAPCHVLLGFEYCLSPSTHPGEVRNCLTHRCVDTPPVCRMMLAHGGSPKCTVKTRPDQRELQGFHPSQGHHRPQPKGLPSSCGDTTLPLVSGPQCLQ